MAKDQDKQDLAGTELDLPDEKSSQAPPKQSSNMSFGMLDLGGGSDAPELETGQPEQKAPAQPRKEPEPQPAPEPKPPPAQPDTGSGPKKAPYTFRSQRSSTSGGPPMARSSRIRQESSEPEVRSAKRDSKTMVIALIVVVALALIGGGIYLFLRWQESAEKERQAEMERLNQQSRDSLMDDRFKNR